MSAAPGEDGISSMVYHKCWDILKTPILEMTKAVHDGQIPTASQHTSVMLFCHKPKKSKIIQTRGQNTCEPHQL